MDPSLPSDNAGQKKAEREARLFFQREGGLYFEPLGAFKSASLGPASLGAVPFHSHTYPLTLPEKSVVSAHFPFFPLRMRKLNPGEAEGCLASQFLNLNASPLSQVHLPSSNSSVPPSQTKWSLASRRTNSFKSMQEWM